MSPTLLQWARSHNGSEPHSGPNDRSLGPLSFDRCARSRVPRSVRNGQRRSCRWLRPRSTTASSTRPDGGSDHPHGQHRSQRAARTRQTRTEPHGGPPKPHHSTGLIPRHTHDDGGPSPYWSRRDTVGSWQNSTLDGSLIRWNVSSIGTGMAIGPIRCQLMGWCLLTSFRAPTAK